MKGPEARLKAAVIPALTLALGRRGFVHRENSGSLVIDSGTKAERRINMGTPGMPDLLVVMDGGRVLFIELKAKAGKVTPNQAAMHERLEALGHRVVIARSVSTAVEAVQEELRRAA